MPVETDEITAPWDTASLDQMLLQRHVKALSRMAGPLSETLKQGKAEKGPCSEDLALQIRVETKIWEKEIELFPFCSKGVSVAGC